jgi:predicted PurR-regulated permease PerM
LKKEQGLADRHQAGQVALIVIAALLVLAALSVSGAVVGPVVFALFITALVYPLQRHLQTLLPRYVALAISFVTVVLVLLAFGWLVAWAFGQVGRWLIADAARLQQFYDQVRLWLEGHGIAVASLWADNFGVGWILRTVQTVSGRLNSTFSFWLVTLVYVLLLLMEVEDFGRRANGLRNRSAATVLLQGSRQTAVKIRRYMLIRTAMSVATGLLVWIFARAIGLPLAEEWGFIAFTLNYIPFIGSFIATLLPTLFALMQLETWQGVLVIFIGLNLIQTIGGSYIEPRLSGSALSMSPALVLFSIFLWGFLWGIFGAFIGVPISIAVLTYCAQHPASAWIADLFGSSAAETSRA